MKSKIVIVALAIVVLYLVCTWFFFGSPHPCKILMARQRGPVIKVRREFANENVRRWVGFVKMAYESKNYAALDELNKGLAEADDKLENVETDVTKSLRRQISVVTPS